MFGSASFVGLTLLTLLLYGALGALMVLLPYLLIQAAAYSAAQAGAALLPFAAILALASPIMGALAGRLGPRLPLTTGPLVVAGGFLLLLRIGPHTDYWTGVLPAILVMAIGMAGAVALRSPRRSWDRSIVAIPAPLRASTAPWRALAAWWRRRSWAAILGTAGSALIGGFHLAAITCALASAAASVACAFFFFGWSVAPAAPAP